MKTESLDRLKSLRARLENLKSHGDLPAIKLMQGKLIALPSMLGGDGPNIIEPEETYEPMQVQLSAVQQYIDNTLNNIKQQKGTNKA